MGRSSALARNSPTQAAKMWAAQAGQWNTAGQFVEGGRAVPALQWQQKIRKSCGAFPAPIRYSTFVAEGKPGLGLYTIVDLRRGRGASRVNRGRTRAAHPAVVKESIQ